MRILIFHGYLLGGTGSNVYNARLARALTGLGHDVHLLCQERHPEEHEFIDAAGDWDSGPLQLCALPGDGGTGRPAPSEERGSAAAGRGSCTVYRPNIGALLPVYVADRYEGIEARTFAECTEEEVAHYVQANVEAVAEVCSLVDPHAALANHLVMGPVILARGLKAKVPYAVKVHGSALEYTVKPQPERFIESAREGLAGARCVLVGSHHTAASLWAALGDGDGSVRARTRLGPPGVDVERFAPREPAQAAAAVGALVSRLAESAPAAANGGDAFARDEHLAAAALAAIDPQQDRLVAFVGKLIVSKGVDLLLAAWPLVLGAVPRARLLIIGFGAYRTGLEALAAALAAGDLDGARAIALQGRALEGDSEPARPLSHLLAFLDGLHGEERDRYCSLARGLNERVTLTGRLDHEELVELLPACEAIVVPSTFPESFGMVAAEAAACGVLPVSAAHSGLAEVSDALARAIPAQAAGWLSFPVDEHAVAALADRLTGWLAAEPELRARTRAGLVETVRERWSWQGVARGVLAGARGELDRLSTP
jgi:glycosyltransferase involved in cell wall biosynthesis